MLGVDIQGRAKLGADSLPNRVRQATLPKEYPPFPLARPTTPGVPKPVLQRYTSSANTTYFVFFVLCPMMVSRVC